MPCSRTQHGLTLVGLEPPTSGSRVRGINRQAIALPVMYKETIQFEGSKLLQSVDTDRSKRYRVHIVGRGRASEDLGKVIKRASSTY